MNALTHVRGKEQDTFKASSFGSSATTSTAMPRSRPSSPSRPRSGRKGEAKPLLDSLIAHVREIPTRERTSPEALGALQLADALASTLPADQARRVRKDLGELGVRVIRIGTVNDQMLFDKERIVVKAGAPVEIVFENTDIMPHNMVVIQPGAASKRSACSANRRPPTRRRWSGTTSPGRGRSSCRAACSSPETSQKLSYNAPRQEGVYPYVCTYPGHWRRMYGALYVVEDLDEYLADPEGYLAGHPLPIEDQLLATNRPRKEWKIEDLATAIEQLDQGRSFANGKQMFQVAACVSCHRLNGVGEELGPDLAKLDAIMAKPMEVLKNILEPSYADQREVPDVRLRAEFGQGRDRPRDRRNARHAEGDREPAGENAARRPRKKSEIVDAVVPHVDHAQGPARQADPRRDPRPGRLHRLARRLQERKLFQARRPRPREAARVTDAPEAHHIEPHRGPARNGCAFGVPPLVGFACLRGTILFHKEGAMLDTSSLSERRSGSAEAPRRPQGRNRRR